MMKMHHKTTTFQPIRKFDSFSIYVHAIFVGFWVWLASYLWFLVVQSGTWRQKSLQDKRTVSTSKAAPNFVTDNCFGRHNYIKIKVGETGPFSSPGKIR